MDSVPDHSGKSAAPARLAVFASGAGSNALKIIQYFRNQPGIIISLVVCNKPGAGVLKIAENEGVETLMLEKERFFRGDGFVPVLKEKNIDFIILAGFLWKIPISLIKAFPSRIINIHPALLPKYGGKGMYGNFVHEAVLNAEETKSGITIHLVDEQYDHGDHLFQISIPVLPGDTPETLANRIHVLEHEHYPVQIEKFIKMSTAG